MAGFFSLGSLTANTAEQEGGTDGGGTSGGGRDNNLPTRGNTADPETNWLLYRNQEITYKGLELWHQQQQQTMQQQQRINPPDLYASAVRLGVGPSSSTRNISAADHNNNNSDDQNNNHNHPGGSLGVRSGGSGSGGYNLMMRGVGGSGGGAVNCQDCGNQAKKDCIHMRCRTCCKSRGFHCPTHVKSTWVPASKRRERLQQQQQQAEQQQPKRHRDHHHHHHASSSARPGATTALSAGMALQNFPSEVSTEALFRCVRVSPIVEDDNNEEQQFAYQTAINVGGHLFKGILYDQGPAGDHQSRYNIRGSGGGGDSSSGTGEAPPPPPLNLISSAAPPNTVVTSSSLATPAIGSSPIAFLDPSLYPASMSSYLAGTQFFPNTRSP